MEDSIRMARIAAESGVETIVATPHANQLGRFENYATHEMQEVFEAFCREVQRLRIPLRILPGMEIYASDDVVEKIRRRMLCPLAGTQYYLIEFPFQGEADEMEILLRQMLANGYTPLIAHPERYACVQRDPGRLARWEQLGCAAQVNRGSLQGRFGRQCAAAAEYLLENGLVHVFGSDAHGPDIRTPEMGSLWEYIASSQGTKRAEQLLLQNPRRLLRGEKL